MICKICSHPTEPFSTAPILDKYRVRYFRCGKCGFVQTETPYWLDEAYEEAISQSDVGLVARNLDLSRLTKIVVRAFFNANEKFIDYGGGYGLFVRLMRDAGLDFYYFDRYCSNLFARNFEINEDSNVFYELLTAFEVFEHLVNPLPEIDQMLRLSRNILFTTTLLPENNPKPNEWWYYGLEHGQHVALYTRAALRAIARQFQMYIYTDGRMFHLLTEKKLPSCLFKLFSHPAIAPLIALFWRRKPLIAEDYFKMTGKSLND